MSWPLCDNRVLIINKGYVGMEKICTNCGNQIPPMNSFLLNDKTVCIDCYNKLKGNHDDATSKKNN